MENKLIIHPTDFSACANNALDYAVNLAKEFNCKILLVHSIDPSKYAGHDQSGQMLMSKSQDIEDEIANKLKTLGGVVVEQGIECQAQIYNGPLNSWLPDMINREKPMFVVMGTTGAGSVANRVFGSNAFATIQSANCPIIAIPGDIASSLPETITLAIDLKAASSPVIDIMRNFANNCKSQLTIVSAVSIADEESSKSKSEEFRSNNPDIVLEMIVNDDYIDAINEFMVSSQPDLIAVVKSEKGILKRLLFDSLTDQLLHYSQTPILIIPLGTNVTDRCN